MSVNNDVVFVTTVEDKINKYNVREYLNAEKARELQKSYLDLLLKTKLIMYIKPNTKLPCNKTRHSLDRRHFGPNIGLIKVKTT